MKRLGLPMLLAAAAVVRVEGHGYVMSPPSRNYACKLKTNSGCGGVQYEPQSVEGPDRYPASGPPDGQLAAAGSATWAPLNEQSSSRWAKTAASGGRTDFTWQFTANHVTLDWRYYITKDGWNQNAPLGRGSFEDAPFCSAAGGMVKPPMVTTHSCTLPSKSGYHVVLAIWDVGDTAASFYNAVDLDFSGGGGGGGGNPVPPVPVPPVPTPPTPPVPVPPVPVPPVPVPPVPVPPVPVPPTTGCSRTIPMWGACTSAMHCCTQGAVCDRQSQWYAQCIPAAGNGNTPPVPTPPTPPVPVPPVPTPPTPPVPVPPVPVPVPPPSSGCRTAIPKWGSCLHAPTCCSGGASCYKQSRWYAQCLTDNHLGYKIG